MRTQSNFGRTLPVAFLFLLAINATSALAQKPIAEPARTQTAGDAELKWSSCPPFMPERCAIAVLHGDPAKANLDVFLKVPAKATIPRHWHTSAERMILVSGEMNVTYEGQKTVVLKPGTYAYGPAKLPHQAFCASSDPCILFIAFESPLDAMPVENPAK